MSQDDIEKDKLIAEFIAGDAELDPAAWKALVASGEVDMNHINSLRSLQKRADEIRRWEDSVRSEAMGLDAAPGVDHILETVMGGASEAGPQPMPPQDGRPRRFGAPHLIAGIAALALGLFGWSLASRGRDVGPPNGGGVIQLNGTLQPTSPLGSVTVVDRVEWRVDLAPGDRTYLRIDRRGEDGLLQPFFDEVERPVKGSSWVPTPEESKALVGEIRISVRIEPMGSASLPAVSWTVTVAP